MVICIIQARMGSSRLPGKVLFDLAGEPLLWHIVNRLRSSTKIDKLLIATSDLESDNQIVELCKNKEIGVFCGNEKDVLDRFYKAACFAGGKDDDVVVRITADCPLIDYQIVDRVIDLIRATGCDYASNVFPPTFPDGLDVEAMKFTVLREAHENAGLLSEREHVTPFIRNNPQRYKIENLINPMDLSHLRWTVDHMEDYNFIKAVYNALYKVGEVFLTAEILVFLKNTRDLQELNSQYGRNEGFDKSLMIDDNVKKQE